MVTPLKRRRIYHCRTTPLHLSGIAARAMVCEGSLVFAFLTLLSFAVIAGFIVLVLGGVGLLMFLRHLDQRAARAHQRTSPHEPPPATWIGLIGVSVLGVAIATVIMVVVAVVVGMIDWNTSKVFAFPVLMLTELICGAFIGGLHVILRKRSKYWVLVWAMFGTATALPACLLYSGFVDSHHAPLGGFGK